MHDDESNSQWREEENAEKNDEIRNRMCSFKQKSEAKIGCKIIDNFFKQKE